MKAIMLASQNLALGQQGVMIAGGMENMTRAPFYLEKARTGYGFGNGKMIDGLSHDGLWDPYDNQPMGMCAEKCADDFGFTREDQVRKFIFF